MSKMLLTIVVLFIASIGLMWYSSQSNKTKPIKELIVGLNAEYPPFAFIENNQIVGFDIDLITEINKRLKKELELKNLSFTSLIPEVQMGSLDIVISGITPTSQRAKEMLFTDPYISSDPLVIVSRADKPLKTIAELQDKRTVVNEGFSADFYLSKHKDLEIVRLKTIDQALLELLSGRSDAFVSALYPLNHYFQFHEKNKLSISVIPETEEHYALGVSKQKNKLHKKIQLILNTLQEDGTLELLKHKWKLNT